jgi:hypothetical protein
MKVVFLLDNNEFIEVEPAKLQLRQVAPGQAVLGLDVLVPVHGEGGVQEFNADGTPKTQTGFRSIINYAVNLTIPAASLEEEITNLKTALKLKKEELVKQQEAASKKTTVAKKSKAKRVN